MSNRIELFMYPFQSVPNTLGTEASKASINHNYWMYLRLNCTG